MLERHRLLAEIHDASERSRVVTSLGPRQCGKTTLDRFWTMVAHYHGQIWNGSELARSLAVSQPSACRYLDPPTDLFMVRQLPSWHANLKKRQVRSPKTYFRDTGFLHQLWGIARSASS